MTQLSDSHIHCVFCKSIHYNVRYETKDLWDNVYNINQCETCFAYYLAPFPSPKILEKAYDETYYGTGGKKFIKPIERFINFFRNLKAKRYSRLLHKKGKVLDIGCGNGGFLKSLSKHKELCLYGSELQGKSAQRAAQHKNIKLNIGPFSRQAYHNLSFDMITLFHVFEHLSNPSHTLEDIDYLLKEGGYLVMSFPNIDSYQSRLFKGMWLHLDPPRHVFFFTPKDFKTLMRSKGYTIVKESYHSLEQNPFGITQSLLNTFIKKREVLFEYFKGHYAYARHCSPLSIFAQIIFFALTMPFAIVFETIAAWLKKGATVEFVLRKNNLAQ